MFLFVSQVCFVIWMMHVSATLAMRGPCVTPIPLMVVLFAPVPLVLLVVPAIRIWMSVPLVRFLRTFYVLRFNLWLYQIYIRLLIICLLMTGANPCEHFGKCVNTEGSFQCQCGRGYAGPRCEIDINECHSMPCKNDATCLDRIGEFTCICMPGIHTKLYLQ